MLWLRPCGDAGCAGRGILVAVRAPLRALIRAGVGRLYGQLGAADDAAVWCQRPSGSLTRICARSSHTGILRPDRRVRQPLAHTGRCAGSCRDVRYRAGAPGKLWPPGQAARVGCGERGSDLKRMWRARWAAKLSFHFKSDATIKRLATASCNRVLATSLPPVAQPISTYPPERSSSFQQWYDAAVHGLTQEGLLSLHRYVGPAQSSWERPTWTA